MPGQNKISIRHVKKLNFASNVSHDNLLLKVSKRCSVNTFMKSLSLSGHFEQLGEVKD